MKRFRRLGLLLAVAVGLAGAPISAASAVIDCGTFGAWVEAFPTPVTDASSLFETVDDAALEWVFTDGFAFPFYGELYGTIFLNTNGGMTFGSGEWGYDLMADEIDVPAIAVFWGDMDAQEHGADMRADQMRWRQSPTCFQVDYRAFQDYDEPDWHNTALVTLVNDGRIKIEYGDVLSLDILIGVFDGTHADDRNPGIQDQYRLSNQGTGIILYDAWRDFVRDADGDYDGALDGMTILFLP